LPSSSPRNSSLAAGSSASLSPAGRRNINAYLDTRPKANPRPKDQPVGYSPKDCHFAPNHRAQNRKSFP
jgi:hypothetical protein